jgi:prohibitin 1
MFYLAALLGLIALGIIFFGIPGKTSRTRWPGYIAAVVALVLFAFSAVVVVPAGHVGVTVLFGSVRKSVLTEGIGFVNPLATIQHISVRTRSFTMRRREAIRAQSKDGLLLILELTFQSHINGADAPWMFQKFGVGRGRATASILVPLSRAAIREAISKFTAQEAYSTKRDAIPLMIRKRLTAKIRQLMKQRGLAGEKVERMGIIIDGVELRNIRLPKRLTAAIEAKLEEQQRAQRMRFVLDRERQEAKRKEIEATGIAKFQEIVTKGIDERLLRWKGIDATLKLALGTNSKVIVIGGGKDGLPLIMNTGK